MNKTINQDNLNSSLRFLEKQGEISMAQLKEADLQQAEKLEGVAVLFRSEEFCKQFLACPDKQTAVQLFADNGFSMTEEEVEVMFLLVNTFSQKLLDNNGELSEEDLEMVAGGSIGKSIFGFLIGGIPGAFVGLAIGSLLCVLIPPLSFAVGAGVATAVGGIGLGVAGADMLNKLPD
jgi:hypothetical protein